MFLINAFTISKIYFLQIKSWSLWFFLHTLFIPIGLVLFVRAAGSDMDSSRLAAGATVLVISSISINATGYWIMMDRFENRMPIIDTLSIHPFSYYLGVMIVSVSQCLINVLFLVLVLNFFSIRTNISIFLPFVTIVSSFVFSLLGISIGKYVKDTNHGSIMMNLLSTGAVLATPIFYSANLLPQGIAISASLTPHMIMFNCLSNIY